MLKDKCHINTNIGNDTFVGIRCHGADISINFPLGFCLAEDGEDKAVRKDILLLIDVLTAYGKRKDADAAFDTDEQQKTTAPLYSYIYLIRDFITRGYYKEGVVEYVSSKRGKINWNRTIKQKKPVIQDTDVFYLDFITKKNIINENNLITMIHQYCVYVSFMKIGWLFTDYVPPKPAIIFHRQWFSSALLAKLNTTFNDSNKSLFQTMLRIINNEPDKGLECTDYTYGTNNFEYVWEHMIDNVFGIKGKKDYFPKTQWKLTRNKQVYDNSDLEPDTIMLTNDNIYVLDAKYYKYGWTKHAGDLPDSASINKQITYAEYIDIHEELKQDGAEIYNAFILPFNKKDWAEEKADNMHYIGEAVSLWKSGSKKYERIQGILLDVKYLMQLGEEHSESDIKQLAKIIEEHCC